MSSSNFLTDPQTLLVADTSVVINLNATGWARAIITAFPNRLVITTNTLAELVGGERNGHGDARAIQTLIDEGIVDLVSLDERGNAIYETLIDGSALQTLDDGEAATISYASQVRGIALIDEQKALKLCAANFPDMPVICTAELLLHETVIKALGQQAHMDAIMSALQKARMRVLPHLIGRIVAIIGDVNAAACSSLPKTARTAS